MFEIRVEAAFAAAHFLNDYHGKCENLHGHNYRVFAHVRGTQLDQGGMLLDFSLLKTSLRQVCALLDHSNLNDRPEFENNPSAERIARWIFTELKARLVAAGMGTDDCSAELFAVDVFETDTSRARYMA